MDPDILIIIAVALIVGLVKGGMNPMGPLIVPLLSMTMPVTQAVGVALPLLMFGDQFGVRAYWREWDSRLLRLTLSGALVGIVMGLALLTSLSDDALRIMLGIFTLGIVVYKLTSDALTHLEYTPHDWHGVLAGWGSGFASALANAGGPPLTAYLLLQKTPPLPFIGTSALFFAIVNALKLPAFLATGVIDIPKLVSILWVLPLIPLGVWLGRQIIQRINQQAFDNLMLVGMVLAGLKLLNLLPV